MSELKDEIIKLAYENPELREQLKPILTRIASRQKVANKPIDLKEWIKHLEREFAMEVREVSDIKMTPNSLRMKVVGKDESNLEVSDSTIRDYFPWPNAVVDWEVDWKNVPDQRLVELDPAEHDQIVTLYLEFSLV